MIMRDKKAEYEGEMSNLTIRGKVVKTRGLYVQCMPVLKDTECV